VIDSLLDAMARSNLLVCNDDRSEWQRPSPTSFEAIQLALLAEATIQTIERYYLVIALLLQAGPGNITQEALEQRCHLMASACRFSTAWIRPSSSIRACSAISSASCAAGK